MKTLLFLLLATSCSFAEQIEIENPYLPADSTHQDVTLSEDETVLYFYFPQSILVSNLVLRYNIDGGEEKLFNPSPEKPLEIKTTAGTHQFQFYYNLGDLAEAYVMVSAPGQSKNFYTVRFREATMIDVVEKPVIYLYPEEKQEVSIKVAPKGKFVFTYPEYNEGWEVVAHPNGQLDIDSSTYNYLFWEAEQPQIKGDYSTAVIAREKITQSLEILLNGAGFTAQERTDFITYWAPRMQYYENVTLGFLIDEQCDEFATLDITPKPDHVYRVYMIWHAGGNLTEMPERLPTIPKMDRSGFTVVEWGGMQTMPPIKIERTNETSYHTNH